jgi:hypothetical protein
MGDPEPDCEHKGSAVTPELGRRLVSGVRWGQLAFTMSTNKTSSTINVLRNWVSPVRPPSEAYAHAAGSFAQWRKQFIHFKPGHTVPVPGSTTTTPSATVHTNIVKPEFAGIRGEYLEWLNTVREERKKASLSHT